LLPRNPADLAKAERLEPGFAGEFGVEVRRNGYEWLFEAFDACAPYNAGAAPPWQLAALNAGRPVAMGVARQYLGVTPEQAARARSIVDREFDAVAALLSDGRRFLVGDAFSCADLTFAAMAAPTVLPPRYGVPLPAPEQASAHARERIEKLRAHPAGAFALSLHETRPRPRGQLERPLQVPRSS
jgi:glutathione S-transferase